MQDIAVPIVHGKRKALVWCPEKTRMRERKLDYANERRKNTKRVGI